MSTEPIRLFSLILGLLFFSFPQLTLAQLVLYDDFSAKTIDPEKWHGVESSGGQSLGPNTEIERRIVGHRLELLLTSYGGTSSDRRTGAAGNNRLRINDPNSVTAMQANVAVTESERQDCPANSTPTRTRTMLNGAFFNDGSSEDENDRTGDIIARIDKQGDSAGNIITAVLLRCENPGCDDTSTLDSLIFATTWKFKIPDTLKMEWDPANDQFHFEVNPGTRRSESATLSYDGYPDDNPPVSSFKELRVQNQVANCTSERKKGSITALFDNVMVNP